METKKFYIVGLGASAGGLQPFEQFFSSLDSLTGMAFVMIWHMPHEHVTELNEIISKYTAMNVEVVYRNCTIEQNKVYIIPGGCHAAIQHGTLMLSPRPHSVLNRSIDYFLNSLAQEYGELAIGIIFSGLGSDGAEGCKNIAANNGKVFVQKPSTATYASMPNSVIHVDEPESLTPEQIALRLNSIASGTRTSV